MASRHVQDWQCDVSDEVDRLPVVGEHEAFEVADHAEQRVDHVRNRSEGVLEHESVNLGQLRFVQH